MKCGVVLPSVIRDTILCCFFFFNGSFFFCAVFIEMRLAILNIRPMCDQQIRQNFVAHFFPTFTFTILTEFKNSIELIFNSSLGVERLNLSFIKKRMRKQKKNLKRLVTSFNFKIVQKCTGKKWSQTVYFFFYFAKLINLYILRTILPFGMCERMICRQHCPSSHMRKI